MKTVDSLLKTCDEIIAHVFVMDASYIAIMQEC